MDNDDFAKYLDNIIRRYSVNESEDMSQDLSSIILESALKSNKHTSDSEHRNSRLEKMIEDLEYRNRVLLNDISEAKQDKKNAERHLKLFLKAASRLGIVDKLKTVTEQVIAEEKDHISYATFFGVQTNQLEKFESILEEKTDITD